MDDRQKSIRMVTPFDNLRKYSIILASGSPRRKELLSSVGIDYKVRIIDDIDESYPENMKAEDIPQFISRKKAAAYRKDLSKGELIITADTVVAVDNKILGKPKDKTEAVKMLRLLSGRKHQVITGVTVMTSEREETFAAVSNVCISKLSDEEIDYYIEKYKPYDKAGAYGIQEWIGMIGVTEIEGSFFNVMGLPVQRLYTLLKTF